MRTCRGEAGTRQFPDIGTGIQAPDNTHHVAQPATPGSRVLYVDYDHCKSGCVDVRWTGEVKNASIAGLASASITASFSSTPRISTTALAATAIRHRCCPGNARIINPPARRSPFCPFPGHDRIIVDIYPAFPAGDDPQ